MKKETTTQVAFTGLFMSMVIVLSMSIFSIPVPGGHLYLCDVVICLAAVLLNPFEAFIACGVGSFLGDFFFYQPPMFVSLLTHGLQGIVVALISQKTFKTKPVLASIIAVFVGAIIMVTGYTLGKTFVYADFKTAMVKLPYEIAQAVVGAIAGLLLCWKCGIRKIYKKYTK